MSGKENTYQLFMRLINICERKNFSQHCFTKPEIQIPNYKSGMAEGLNIWRGEW